jgi:PAS domain S-box-containing protein
MTRHDVLTREAAATEDPPGSAAADAAEPQRWNDALRRSEQRWQSLVNTVDGIVWEVDPATFRFLFVSDQAERLLGYPTETWYEPGFWAKHVHPDDRGWAIDFCAQQTAEKRPHEFEYRMIAADGRTVWLRDIVSVVCAEGEPMLLRGIMVDVTERKRTEEARASLESELRQSQKMEAIGRLAGGVAHDFNNLLTAIIGFASLLDEELPASDPRRADVEGIQQAATSASALVSQLLAFSRRQVHQPQAVNVNQVVERVVPMLRRLLGEQVILVTDLDPEIGRVWADPGQIEQLIINLAVNARDAMPDGGTLKIVTQGTSIDGPASARRMGLAPGRHLALRVEDEGVGMSPEVRDRIFEPFFTTKEPGRGTGLGMTTVYGIVAQSSGHIEVVSEPNRGTTVQILLPTVTGDAPDAPERAKPQEAARGTETVLLVEDESTVRALTTTVLERSGYRVHAVASASEALALLVTRMDSIDLLVTDVVMPGMSGTELARQVGAMRPALPVLFISGYSEESSGQLGSSGAVAFLAKPFTPDAIVRAVRSVLDGAPTSGRKGDDGSGG